MNWTWAAARYLRQPFSKVCLKNHSCNLHARFARDFALIRLTQPAAPPSLRQNLPQIVTYILQKAFFKHALVKKDFSQREKNDMIGAYEKLSTHTLMGD